MAILLHFTGILRDDMVWHRRHTESSEDKETVIEKLEKIQKKGHKKQILSMLKNTSKKDMMSTTKSNKTKNENQRFVV